MKTVGHIILGLCVACCASRSARAGSLEDLEAKNGFRDLKLGASFDAVGFSKLSTDKDTTAYTRASDKLEIGSSSLDMIMYAEYDGKLISVSLVAEGKSNCDEIEAVLRAAYGDGAKRPVSNERTWMTKSVMLAFSWNPIKAQCFIIYASRPLSDERTAARETAAKGTAKSDL